ncbi:hypothetical protein PHMEG_00019924 [Phytophthora megakarya]|uniref:Uncharacterized protein n=1 Tax=Phytophthora megakarya TaxID=4795 RepID=A0A225VSA8_9STRA|nr:hypothetical protein PHMEG_00019924 [Phytophthora megakarya]
MLNCTNNYKRHNNQLTTYRQYFSKVAGNTGTTYESSLPTRDEHIISAYFNNGKFHMLPQTCEFPKCEACGASQLWRRQRVPPLKRIITHDLPHEQMRKRFQIEVASDHGYKVTTDMTEQFAEKNG